MQKAYNLRNFNTLVAILAGLDSHWVKDALRQSNAKLGMWENRMLRDLQQWTTSEGNFKHIRQTIEALAESKSTNVASPDGSTMGTEGLPSTSRSRATSEGKLPALRGCIPFFGAS